jgi:hypothetical protein
MKISRQDIAAAAERAHVTPQQADDLWAALEAGRADQANFNAPNVAYYLGAMIVIGAMGWFMNKAWEDFGGWALFVIAAGYAVLFVMSGNSLWGRPGSRVPGGLLYTMAVCMTPLAVYGLERATGVWPDRDPGVYQGFHEWIKGGWFVMELATIGAGAVALKFRRYPFLVAPIAFTLWYMSMDIAPLLYGRDAYQYREWVSVWFGLAVLLASYLVDLRNRSMEDFAFWGYLFGLLAFWGGLSLMNSHSELGKFIYCVINLSLMVKSIVLRQRMFLVFGSLGVMGYLGHLAYKVFENSLLFPFALSALGILIIYLGVLFQRHKAAIDTAVQRRIPPVLRALVPERARG